MTAHRPRASSSAYIHYEARNLSPPPKAVVARRALPPLLGVLGSRLRGSDASCERLPHHKRHPREGGDPVHLTTRAWAVAERSTRHPGSRGRRPRLSGICGTLRPSLQIPAHRVRAAGASRSAGMTGGVLTSRTRLPLPVLCGERAGVRGSRALQPVIPELRPARGPRQAAQYPGPRTASDTFAVLRRAEGER